MGASCFLSLREVRTVSKGLATNRNSISVLFGVPIPAFLVHIVDIISLRTQEQVSRIHTSGVVSIGAVVQNQKSIGNRTIDQSPSNTMGAIITSIISKMSIAIVGLATCPKPAAVWRGCLVNLAPKACVKIIPTTVFAIFPRRKSALRLVVSDVAGGLALHPAISAVSVLGDSRELPTATVTISIRNTVKVKRNLYNIHVTNLLTRLVAKPGMLQASPGISMSNYNIFLLARHMVNWVFETPGGY